MRYSNIAILLLILLTSFRSFAKNGDLIEELRKAAYPIESVDPYAPLDDLSFLKDLIKNKSVIALGEATHGSKEFFTMKHRLVRYLVEEAGYRVFIIEANQPECIRINDYVMHGKGSPEEALFNIYFWTWNTNEVLKMIKWMRSYNEGKADKDKVRFYGCDMQYTIAAAGFIMRDLDSLQIDYSHYKNLLDSLSSKSFRHLSRKNTSELKAMYNQAVELFRYSDKYKTEFIEKSDAKYFMQHHQYLNILLQAMTKYTSEDGNFRDSCMAVNTKWISDYEQTDKIIVWAHNAHISKTKAYTTAEGYQMGYRLNKLFPDKYYVIGFDFHDGSFRAMNTMPTASEKSKKGTATGVVTCTIKKPAKNSSDHIYHKTGLPMFYLDYKKASANEAIKTYLNTITRIKIIGAIFNPKWEETYYQTVILNDYYDATIFINSTTPTVATDYYKAMYEQAKALKK